jgi:hypothetical protein
VGFIFDAGVGHMTSANVDTRDDIKDVGNMVTFNTLHCHPYQVGFNEFALVVLL